MLGWVVDGDGVESVNGVDPVGGDVPLTATDIPSTGPSTVQTDLDAHAAALAPLAGLIVIDSVDKLESEFPNVAGVHTIDKQTLWVSQTGAPIDLSPTGRSIEIVHPGAMFGVAYTKVTVIGDVAGPLCFGELFISGISFRNDNASGSDLACESLSGRFVLVERSELFGQVAGTFANTTGLLHLFHVALIPASPNATGLVLDGVLAIVSLDTVSSQPSGGPYVTISIAGTSALIIALRAVECGVLGVLGTPGVLLDIDASATLPTSPLPTDEFGVEIFGCTVKGPGSSLFSDTGLGADDIRVYSTGNVSGPSSTFIGDARVDTTGVPAIALDHVGQAGNPLVVPSDNSQNGGTGGTLRSLTPAASMSRYTLLTKAVTGATVNAGGTYTGGDGDYPATQASSSGAGEQAEFTVTLTGGTITAVVTVDDGGHGYVIADTITLAVDGPTETVAAVLDVSAVASSAEWSLRTDGPLDQLSGSVSWSVSYQRGAGGAGSKVYGYIERLNDGIGLWAEVPGTRSVLSDLTNVLSRASGSALLNDINHADQWRIVWVNDNVGATETLFVTMEPVIEGRT